MYCSKCGRELKETVDAYKKQTVYKCSSCNTTLRWDDKKSQWVIEKNAPKDHMALKVIGLMLLVIISIGLIIGGLADGGDDGIVTLSIGVFGAALFAFLLSFRYNFKKARNILIITAAAQLVLAISAVNDFPEFIREIQGKDFIGIWLGYGLVVYLSALAVGAVLCRIFVKANEKKLIAMNYSDSDLMLLQNFSSYKMTGYYLLKAKLHGVIHYYTVPQNGYSDSIVYVVLNKKIPQEKLEAYCEQNPQVKKIVEFLKKKEAAAHPVRVSDIVTTVKPNPEIQSVGGQAATAACKSLTRRKWIVFAIAAGLVYYVGVTKLLMGLHNSKQISNLITGGFILSFVMIAVFCSLLFLIYRKATTKMMSNITLTLQVNLLSYAAYAQPFLNGEEQATVEDQQKILRCYATDSHNASNYVVNADNSGTIINSIFTSVFAIEAHIAAQNKQSGSDGGCSSCSSCSSCGGGCGGCGGCGN